jgi:betaine-aldehyde dehydrogenase
MSTYSFDEYTQIKHVMSALSPEPRKSWHDVVFTSTPGISAVHG